MWCVMKTYHKRNFITNFAIASFIIPLCDIYIEIPQQQVSKYYILISINYCHTLSYKYNNMYFKNMQNRSYPQKDNFISVLRVC